MSVILNVNYGFCKSSYDYVWGPWGEGVALHQIARYLQIKSIGLGLRSPQSCYSSTPLGGMS